MGTVFTQPNSLNKIAFHSITGSDASGHISPSHNTALPSLTITIVLPFMVRSYALSISFAIARQGAATQGVYAILSSSAVVTGILEIISSFHWYFL
jgi:hypothetical protein